MLCIYLLAITQNCSGDKENPVKISDTRVTSVKDASELRKDSLKNTLLKDDENDRLQIRTIGCSIILDLKLPNG